MGIPLISITLGFAGQIHHCDHEQYVQRPSAIPNRLLTPPGLVWLGMFELGLTL